jgi:branched-chain amino acid transport system ATP-binding protein
LIGANGAGKTTTLKTISGLRKVSSGSIIFDGQDISKVAAHERVDLGISQAPEGRGIFPGMTVLENLEIGKFNRKDRKNEMSEDLERVYHLFPRLKERAAQAGGTLSGGEQQMLTIGRALMTNPDVLILDEATEGLAPLIAREIWRICSVIKESGISSIIVDKNWKHVTKITDRNVILVKGEVVFEGSSELLQSQPEIMAQHLGV